MHSDRYAEIVRGFAGRRLVVLGDLMMDEYLWGKATRISPESPVMVVDVERETRVPGGAANVVNNLLALGAEVAVIGLVGDDPTGEALRADLRDRGADVSGILTDPSRRTTRKTRVLARNQQVLRVDREQTHPVSREMGSPLLDRLREQATRSNAILLSDYNKGLVTAEVARAAVEVAQGARVPLTANPKPPSVRALAGADVVQFNLSEAEAAGNDPRFRSDETIEAAGADLVRAMQIGTLVVTRGAKGLTLWRSDASVTHIRAHPVEVYDEAGAGDTVISVTTLAMAAGALVEEAAEVANHAAACVVRKVGVATVTPDELLADWT